MPQTTGWLVLAGAIVCPDYRGRLEEAAWPGWRDPVKSSHALTVAAGGAERPEADADDGSAPPEAI